MNSKSILPLLLLLLLLLFFTSESLQEEDEPSQQHYYWPKIKTLYNYVPSYFFPPKTLLNHVQSYLFPPNLDFRNDEPVVEETEGGAATKVKEAVAKSLGKGSAAVEESAKSAAEKMHHTAQKLMSSDQEL